MDASSSVSRHRRFLRQSAVAAATCLIIGSLHASSAGAFTSTSTSRGSSVQFALQRQPSRFHRVARHAETEIVDLAMDQLPDELGFQFPTGDDPMSEMTRAILLMPPELGRTIDLIFPSVGIVLTELLIWGEYNKYQTEQAESNAFRRQKLKMALNPDGWREEMAEEDARDKARRESKRRVKKQIKSPDTDAGLRKVLASIYDEDLAALSADEEPEPELSDYEVRKQQLSGVRGVRRKRTAMDEAVGLEYED
eukprot:TRINITY_DN53489_c0_g1_i1.p1 TRINITY_DN53489_c0_g1~~TRINITY_DN53489_c0_g1_i1.p1  ORF type:complete len:269 (+),score=49.97 TRINITY_DN53489_c0_g1_i1:52-807(+)